jgi:hypothetical protein
MLYKLEWTPSVYTSPWAKGRHMRVVTKWGLRYPVRQETATLCLILESNSAQMVYP